MDLSFMVVTMSYLADEHHTAFWLYTLFISSMCTFLHLCKFPVWKKNSSLKAAFPVPCLLGSCLEFWLYILSVLAFDRLPPKESSQIWSGTVGPLSIQVPWRHCSRDLCSSQLIFVFLFWFTTRFLLGASSLAYAILTPFILNKSRVAFWKEQASGSVSVF